MKYLFVFLLIVTFYNANGQVKLLSLNELTNRIAKGKDTTYVINFWATWCAPCIAELPNFEKLGQAKLNKPLKVILISLDFKSKLKSAVIPFVKKNKIKSEVFLINESDQQAFMEKVDKDWSGAIPATLIINTSTNRRSFYEKEFSYKELTDIVDIKSN